MKTEFPRIYSSIFASRIWISHFNFSSTTSFENQNSSIFIHSYTYSSLWVLSICWSLENIGENCGHATCRGRLSSSPVASSSSSEVVKAFLRDPVRPMITPLFCKGLGCGLFEFEDADGLFPTVLKLVWTRDIEPGRKVGSYCHSEAEVTEVKFLGILPEVDNGLKFKLAGL